jgi:nickel-dependent lactate racemase
VNIRLPWGSDALDLQVPDSWNLVFPKATETPRTGTQDEAAIVRQALDQPAESGPIFELDLRNKAILIIVDDTTRPTPAYRFFHLVLDDLERAGAAADRITVMPALGIHTPMTEAEMAAKIGPHNLARVHWHNHNAFDESNMQSFGRTERGTPVELNRAVAEADVIVLIGMIEPHLWAGFGGGLKSILPGVASAQCIGLHHAILAEPPYRINRVGMEPDANSFRHDLEDIRRLISARIFCLNVVLDHTERIIAAFAGDPVAAHRRGVKFNQKVSGRFLPQQVDAVVVDSHPMDINFKQSMKGVANSLPALKPGGLILGYLRAQRGIDDIRLPEDAKPLWLMKRILRLLGPSRVRWFLEKIRPGLTVEEKFLLYYSLQLIRQYDLYFYVPSLTAEEIRRLGFFKHFDTPQAVIDQACRKLARKPTVAVFPLAGATFPIVAMH